MTQHGTGQMHAIGAGLCAACASVFAKLAVTSDVVLEVCHNALHLITTYPNTTESRSRYSSVQQSVLSNFCLPVNLSVYSELIHAIEVFLSVQKLCFITCQKTFICFITFV